MSLLKKLQIGNNQLGKYTHEYLLKDYHCHTCRHHNEYRPYAEKYCERIDLTVIAPGRQDVNLYDWFVRQLTENGRILIELPPKGTNLNEDRKEVLFTNASVFSLEEEFHFDTNRRRLLKLSIVADEVIIDGIKFNRI